MAIIIRFLMPEFGKNSSWRYRQIITIDPQPIIISINNHNLT